MMSRVRVIAQLFVIGVDHRSPLVKQLTVGDAGALEFSRERRVLVDDLVVLFPLRKRGITCHEQSPRLAGHRVHADVVALGICALVMAVIKALSVLSCAMPAL